MFFKWISIRYECDNMDFYSVCMKALGTLWEPRWAKKDQDGAKMAQDGAKMGQDGAKMAQDGVKMAQDGAKMVPTSQRFVAQRLCVEFGEGTKQKKSICTNS